MDYVSLAASMGIMGVVRGDELRAKCPMHVDRNPSFSLNIGKGSWICFSGCGAGSFQTLVENVLGYSWQEASEWIKSSGRKNSVEELSRRLAVELGQIPGQVPVDINQHWKTKYLSLPATTMPIWFLNRGFSWSTIAHWGIRYDPVYDAVIVPVRWKGELVGTVTRRLVGEPKYKNSPNLNRSEILFGLEEIGSNNRDVIIVEGLLDCLWLWQNGYSSCSLLGSSLSRRQVEILKEQRKGQIVLGLDNDVSGVKGTREAIKTLTSNGYLLPQLSFISWPQKDANDVPKESLSEVVENRISWLDIART